MSKLYLDVESGTFFVHTPLQIDTSTWTDEDHDAFGEIMSDMDRSAWAEYYLEATNTYVPAVDRPPMISPSRWCESDAAEAEVSV